MIGVESQPVAQETFRAVLRDAAQEIQARVTDYRNAARHFYYEVLYSIYKCPGCDGKLVYSGPSRARCACGIELDPTVEFQQSSCCSAPLKKRVMHYACRSCGRPVRSMFLFDERVFDQAYFREMMQQSRERKQQKREELQMLLAGTRSDPLDMDNSVLTADFDELDRALNVFLGDFEPLSEYPTELGVVFHMETYREAMRETIEAGNIRFSAFHPLCKDIRKDRAWRFITLIYMEHEREVDLEQAGEDIWVRRHETHREG